MTPASALLGVILVLAPPIPFDEVARKAAEARDKDQLDEAIRWYREGTRLRPSWDEGLWYLATLLYEEDRFAEARDAFRRFLVVKPETPVNSAKELAALAAEKPGAIPFASTGSGSTTHLALELYQSAAKVKFLHVPYRGAAPALTDLLGGQVTAMFADTPVLLPHIRAGKLKPIGAASASRNPLLPDVATLAEQGFPDTVADNWYGLLAPAKTPPAIVAKLHDAVVAVLEALDVRETLLQSGAVPAPTSSAEFGKILSDELARWGRVVREKSIKED